VQTSDQRGKRLPFRMGELEAWHRQGATLLAQYATLANPDRQRSAQTEHPSGRKDAPAAAIVSVAVLRPWLVRVRLAPDGAFAPRRPWAVVRSDNEFEIPAVDINADDACVQIATPDLRVSLMRQGGAMSITTDGIVNWDDGADGGPTWALDGQRRWTTGMPRDRHYYGFGERTGLLEKRGRSYTCWTTDEWEHQGPSSDALYVAIPFFLTIDHSGNSVGVFLNNTYRTIFDLTAVDADRLEVNVFGGELDYYVILGPDPAVVVRRFSELTGTMSLPPRWALGYHQSRWSYATAAEVRAIAHEFRSRRIPCDAIHLDIDHMDGCRVFTWDRQAFANPPELSADLRSRGIKLVAIVDAAVKYQPEGGYDVYSDGHERGYFLKQSREANAEEFLGHVWPGLCAFPDHTRPEIGEWWARWYRTYLDSGISGFLNDMNEPAMHDRPYTDLSGRNAEPPPDLPFGTAAEGATHAEVRNVYALLENRATYEGLRAIRPDERPFILTRAGFAGIQQYAAVWTGDLASYWEHLEMSLAQLLNLGVSGVPFAGADIGGFFGNCDGELLARWMQLGAFYPFMRCNSARGTARQEPWVWGEAIEHICRRAIELRYRLMPYLYTTFEEATRCGAPVLRPLFFQYPDDPAARLIGDQALVGSDLLIAPVLRPGCVRRAVYLPRGDWCDVRTRTRHEGPCTILAEAPLDMDIPLFARAGSVVPWGPISQCLDDTPWAPLTLRVYPDRNGRATGRLYEDDGTSYGYRRGARRITTFSCQVDDQLDGVMTARAVGDYNRGPRKVEIIISGLDDRTVVVHETADSWDTRVGG
jgi:alpha-glucosidase